MKTYISTQSFYNGKIYEYIYDRTENNFRYSLAVFRESTEEISVELFSQITWSLQNL